MFNNKDKEPERIDLTQEQLNILVLHIKSCNLPEPDKIFVLRVFGYKPGWLSK